MASRPRLHDRDESHDPELLRLPDKDVPADRLGTGLDRRRRRARAGLFLPATSLPEIQAATHKLSTARALGLWLTVRAQAKVEGGEWVRVRAHLLAGLGLSATWARSRAYAELERAGLVELRRRKGYAPLVRLVARHAGEAEGGGSG